MGRTVEERFWSKVAKGKPDECWPWLAWKTHNGYGSFGYRGHEVRAHRFVFYLSGITIPEGYEPDHLCYNRDCINPAHLEIVTQRENIIRGKDRLRMLCQAADKPMAMNSKLTADQARIIRSDPRKVRALSEAFNVSQTTIRNVKTGETYRHLL